MVWVGSLLFLALFWVYLKRHENIDEQRKQEYKLDVSQSEMFDLFAKFMHENNFSSVSYEENGKYLEFSKGDFFNFIHNYYFVLKKVLLRNPEFLSNYDDGKYRKYALERNLKFLANRKKIFSPPGEIDISTAQELTDIIIKKLMDRNLVEVQQTALTDKFRYKLNQ